MMSIDDLVFEITEMIAETDSEETKTALAFCRNRISKMGYDIKAEVERKDNLMKEYMGALELITGTTDGEDCREIAKEVLSKH